MEIKFFINIKKMEIVDQNEKSLLMFFETCIVDQGCKVHSQHMNAEDFDIANKWNESGFIKFGRIKFKEIVSGKTNYVIFSEDAWIEAHKARKERGLRQTTRFNEVTTSTSINNRLYNS